MALKNNLKSLRAKNNITQREMCELLGMTIATYNYKENNKNEFTQSEIMELIDIFNVPFEEIFFIEGVPVKRTIA